MKNTFITIVTMWLFMGLTGCNEVTVGYLDTRNAVYIPDSVVFKAALNPEDKDDARQIKFEIPFQGAPIQGIQGTLPISYSIHRIDGNNVGSGVLSQFRMTGNGIVELPFNHIVPAGEYIFSIAIRNEGYTHVVDSVFTVIVK